MDGKKIALLVGALFVAAVTAIMARSMFSAAPTPQAVAAVMPQQTGPEVLVATKPLPVGTIIGPDAVRFQPWPKELVDGAYFVKGAPNVDPVKMQGMVVRSAITVGQPLTQGALVSPSDRGFLAAALTPGMRAVTLSVSGASSVAGFIFPGDRVDVVLTQDVAPQDNGPSGGGSNQALHASETIMRNVRVLATDQRTDNVPTPEGKTDVRNFSLVTVEATPKMAEAIAVSQRLGSLSLSLRPLADDTEQLEQAIAAGDVKLPAGTDPKKADKVVVDLARKPQEGSSSYTVGGEVSRFARSSLPRPQIAMAAAPPMAMPGGAAPAPASVIVTGPVIRVARGNNITDTPVGGK